MEERTGRRPRIADVAREAGVSKTAVSFAFNSPGRLAPETATRIRTVADSLGYRPHPVARMLTQRATRTIGVLTPAGAVGDLLQPVLRGVLARASRSRPSRRATRSTSSRPCTARSPARWTGHGRRGGRHRPVGAPPGDRAAARRRRCRWSWSTRARCPTSRRSRSTTKAARTAGGRAPHRPRASRRAGRRHRAADARARHGLEGVGTRRMRGYRGALDGSGVELRGRRHRSSRRPGSRAASPRCARAWEDGLRPPGCS